MALIAREIIKKYNYVFTESRDPRLDDYFLMSSPLPIMLIVAAYVYFVKSLGPRIMRDRPPFKLNRLIQVYDATQICLNFFLVYKIVHDSYVYFLIKIFDFMDTIFFVLRKKDKQISFLHVYHHAIMALGIWSGMKFIAGGHSVFLGVINSIVHTVMYSYYLMTSIYPEQKKIIWWKKHITQLQMTQFVLVIVHSGQVLLQPQCAYPKFVSMVMVPQNVFMFVLFYDFYCKAYFPKKNQATTATGKTD